MSGGLQPAFDESRWSVQITAGNTGSSRIIPAPNVLVAMHRGIERSGLDDKEITKLEITRVR